MTRFAVAILLLLPARVGAECPSLVTAQQAINRGDAASARTALKPCLGGGRADAETLFLAAQASLGLADPDSAVRLLAGALKAAPTRSVYHRWLAHAYGVQALRAGTFGQISLGRRAVVELETVVRLDPGDLDARIELLDFLATAPGLFGGDAVRAAAEAREIARRDPLRGLQAEARLALAKGDAAAAEERIQLAVSRYPERAEGSLWLGLLRLRRHQPEQAIAPFERGLALAPEAPVAVYGLGAALAAGGGDAARAEALLRRYLVHLPGPGEPSRADALYHLALVHRGQGKTAAARAELEEALRFDPDHSEARKALAPLQGG